MSKLGDLIRRLAAQKGLVVDNAAGDTGDGSSSGGAGGAPSPSIYGSKSYWEDRYETGILGHSSERGVMSNEWYLAYPALAGHLKPHLALTDRILVLGCGLSTIAFEMEKDGFHNITCVDYSPICIERMSAAATESGSGVEYRVMDVTCLEYEEDTWDCVLDKATLDSLINAEGGEEQVLRMLQEADRVLSNGGRYVCISHSDRREMLLSRGFCSWELEAQDTLAKNKARFWMGVYVKRKQPNGNGSALRT